MLARLRRYHSCGRWAGKMFSCAAVLEHLYWRWLEWLQPACNVDQAPDWPAHVEEEGR